MTCATELSGHRFVESTWALGIIWTCLECNATTYPCWRCGEPVFPRDSLTCATCLREQHDVAPLATGDRSEDGRSLTSSLTGEVEHPDRVGVRP